MISRSLFFIFIFVPVMIVGIPLQFVVTRLGLNWAGMSPQVSRWIPSVRILHPYPSERFSAMHPR